MAVTDGVEIDGMAIAVPTDLFIGGSFVPAASHACFDVEDPATERVIANVANGGIIDGVAAVDAAASALGPWSERPPRERSEILRSAFEMMREREQDLALLIVRENGKSLSDARAEVSYAAEFFRWFAEEAVRMSGSIVTAPAGDKNILVTYEPIGVSLLVTPWNFPAAMVTRKLAPALAAGCTTVVKPPAETPLSALAIAAILSEAGVDPGVVNVVPTNDSASLIDALLELRSVRKLSFTGSTEVGRILLRKAADRVVSCSMELGGNAPFIVFADCELDAAVEGALVAKMRNGGASCIAGNRFYVERPIADEFARRLADAMGSLRVGPGVDPTAQVGPLVNEQERTKVERLVEEGLSNGASLLIGGARPDTAGYFYMPTVLNDVPAQASLVAEEIFGPVAPVIAFEDEDEVVSWSNDTESGLASYLYTGDLAKGLRVAGRIETGMVGLNRGVLSDPAAPFGGVKQSGIGREGAHEGLLEFLEAKYIAASW